ncbi:MAG: hypothetical protein ACHQ7M_06225 [Chloroflexota bacterium]
MPLAALLEQLGMFGERIGRDVTELALEVMREYSPETAGERWLQAADGFVAVHGEHVPKLSSNRPKRELAAALQRQGTAAAPVLTPDEAS